MSFTSFVKILISSVLLIFFVLGCTASSQKPALLGEIIQKRQKNTSETIVHHPPPNNLEVKRFYNYSFSKSNIIRVALLLPLSGKYSNIGENLLDSAQLALFALNDPSISIIPIDTKGTSYGAIEAAKKAIDKNVQIVLGPVFSLEAKAVAPVLQEAQIEFVSFSNDESLIDSGALLIGVSPQQQIRRVVSYAISKGIEDYVTLAPNNSLGAAAARIVRETVAEYEGTSVIKTEIHLINKKGMGVRLNRHVNSAIHSAINNKPQKDYNEEMEMYNLNPIIYPRGMVIDGSVENLERIAKIIEKNKDFSNRRIRILGTMRLSDDKLRNLESFQGAVFASLPNKRKEYFNNKFFDNYGYGPLNISSLAYDGIALVATLSKLSKGTDFSREAITNPRGFGGIDGIFRIKPNGLTERGLSIMQIREGELFEIEPAPKRFVDIKIEKIKEE